MQEQIPDVLRKGDCMFAHFDSSLEILPKGEKENKRTDHFSKISVSSTTDRPSKELHFENFHILDKLLVCRFQARESSAYLEVNQQYGLVRHPDSWASYTCLYILL